MRTRITLTSLLLLCVSTSLVGSVTRAAPATPSATPKIQRTVEVRGVHRPLLDPADETLIGAKNGRATFDKAQLAEKSRAKRNADFVAANPEAKEGATVKSAELPERFSWVERGMVTPVKDQGSYGTCWAFASTATLESAYLMRHREVVDLAEQDLVNCNCRRCDGKSLEQHDLKRLAGLRLESQNDYDGDGNESQCKLENCGPCQLKVQTPYRLEMEMVPVDPDYASGGKHEDLAAPTAKMKRALFEHGPLYAKMHIPTGSKIGSFDGNGVFDETIPLVYEPERNNGAHLVSIVGWDDSKKAWRIKNSWGEEWADGGFAWLKYGSNRLGMGASWFLAHAPDERVTAVWRKAKADEVQVHGWTYAQFQDKYDRLWKKGWRIHLLETTVEGKEVLYSAVWRKGDAAEMQSYGRSREQYQKQYDELWKDGWRIHLLNTYIVDGHVRYDAVWRKTKGGETQYYGLEYPEFQKKYDKLWKDGWRIHVLNQYVVGGHVKYDAIWRTGDVAEMQFYGMRFGDYKKKYDELSAQGWRLHILNNYEVGGHLEYSAIWRKVEGEEKKIYGWDYDAFRAKDAELRDKGWRLHVLNAI